MLKKQSEKVELEHGVEYREIGVRSHCRGVFHKKPTTANEIGDKRVFWVHPKAFVVNIVFAWEQAVALTSNAEKGMIASHRFPMWIPKDKASDLEFLLFFFQRKRGKYFLELASPGGAGRNKTLGQQEFAKLKVVVPEPREQKKIASFLSGVDEKIGLLKEKRKLLERYKKGLMQQIFSQKIRFKDDNGNDFPDWEEHLLSSVMDFERTNSLSRADLNDKGGGFQNIHYGDIHTKFSKQFFGSREVVPFVKNNGFLTESTATSFCKVGDIVFADASEDYNDVGKAIEILELTSKPLLAGLHTFLARPKDSKLALGFASYLMQFERVRKQIMRLAQGISVLGISKSNLKKVVLPMPQVDEQQKIAGFLLSVDEKIDFVAQQITHMQDFKKGLLQQMFV